MTCDLCHQDSSKLLPMTIRSHRGPPYHIVGRVCAQCAGPAFPEERETTIWPQVRRGSGMVWPANGR